MNALEKVYELFQELETLRPLSIEDEQRIMQKFRLDWNYHSNHLEGNQLTFGETKALILFNITAQGKPLKDHIEMTGHNEAIEWIIEVIKEEQPLTENFIRSLHKLLLKEPYEVGAITPDGQPTKKLVKVGEYKSTPNHVKTKTGEIFRFASPEETPAKMHDLLEWYRSEREKEERNAIILAAEFHYRFIRIHPFDDGNGRLARILMNFILMSFRHPPVVIKTEDKENYFSVLRLADADQFEPFVNYIAENLTHSLELMIKGAKGEEIEEPDDLEKEIVLLGQKIHSLGNRTKKPRNFDDYKRFYKESIGPLFSQYSIKMSLFEKFYLDSELRVYTAGGSTGEPGINTFEENEPSIEAWNGTSDNLKAKIELVYEFEKPLDFELYEFRHRSSIVVKFENYHIEIGDPKKKDSIRLLHDENLNKSQIDNLVKKEMRLHKDRLESFIEEISKE